MIDSLIKLGLSPNEALIYKTLLDCGPCFVAPLVHHSKKHRQIVYNALEILIKRNLIIVSKKNGKNYYAISDPDRLLIEIKQKEVLAIQLEKQIRKQISAEQEQVEVFTGPNSYHDGLADFRARAEEAQEYIVIGGEPPDWFEFTKPFFIEHVEEVKRLKRKGIPIQILFFETERASAMKYIGPHTGNPYHLRITKSSPKLPQTCWLAGDHVYFLTPAIDPLVIHTKSKALAEEYHHYFNQLWKKAENIKNKAPNKN